MFPKMIDANLPLTADEAVDTLLADLSLLERNHLAYLSEDELGLINRMVGHQIVKDFRLWSGNESLLRDCLDAIADEDDDELDPTMVIVRAMWQKLQDTHVLRLVK